MLYTVCVSFHPHGKILLLWNCCLIAAFVYCEQFHFKLSGLKYEKWIQHPTRCRCVLADCSVVQQLPQIVIITFFTTWKLGWRIFLYGWKTSTQAVWLHREATTVMEALITVISEFLNRVCLNKVSLITANKGYPRLAAATGSLSLLADNPHAHILRQKSTARCVHTTVWDKHRFGLFNISVCRLIVKAKGLNKRTHKHFSNNYPSVSPSDIQWYRFYVPTYCNTNSLSLLLNPTHQYAVK